MIKKILGLILLVTVIAKDSNARGFSRQDAVSILGAIAGGVGGSNIGKGKGRMVGAAVGAVSGGMVAHWLGENLDQEAQVVHYNTTQVVLERMPTGQRMQWQDPDSDARGYVMPTRTYKSHSRYCREYTQVIMIGGRLQEAYGTACRTPEGDWEILR